MNVLHVLYEISGNL